MTKPKLLRSLKFYFWLIDLIRQKNRELRERDETIRDLRRKLFFYKHGTVVADLQAKGIEPYGDRQRAGL